jgi:dTDP-glucose pyrophosphorylase
MSSLWGIIPSAGCGTRIQPLAFSKELLPVGSFRNGPVERPRAVSEYLIDRMHVAGVSKICMIISPGKWDIIRYYGAGIKNMHFSYTIQESPSGLCDAVFRAVSLINADDHIIVGLPDTVWFPENGLCSLPDGILSFLLFPVDRPELYDAVETDNSGFVKRIHVKLSGVSEKWIWGAFKMPGFIMFELYNLWKINGCKDEYFGTLVNKFIENGAPVVAKKVGSSYVDVGTLHGYREALLLLAHVNEIKDV